MCPCQQSLDCVKVLLVLFSPCNMFPVEFLVYWRDCSAASKTRNNRALGIYPEDCWELPF